MTPLNKLGYMIPENMNNQFITVLSWKNAAKAQTPRKINVPYFASCLANSNFLLSLDVFLSYVIIANSLFGFTHVCLICRSFLPECTGIFY